MNDKKLRICLAIPTYNRERVLLDTIQQVMNQDPPPDEIIVVDQSEQHEEVTALALKEWALKGSIRLIDQVPPNLPRARNRVLRETSCDIVVFIDDDVQLTPGFVGQHLSNYEDSNVCAVAGAVIQKGGPSGEKRPATWPRLLDYLYLRLDGVDRIENIANFIGCNHSVRRSAVLSLNGYDENFTGWAYREDSDLAIRLWRARRIIVFDPHALLTHLATPTGGCRLSRSMPEWSISFPAVYFALKNLFPARRFWLEVLILNVRKYVFRKENVFRPWRLPWGLLSYGQALVRAYKALDPQGR